MNFDDLVEEFDDLARSVASSTNQFFATNLKVWFTFLENNPDTAKIFHEIRATLDFDKWKQHGMKPRNGMGHGTIDFPAQTDQRLAALIGIFQPLTENRDAAWRFSREYVSLETHFDSLISELTSQLFDQLSSSLRRRLVRELDKAATDADSNRTVVVIKDDTWKAALNALEKLRLELQQSNQPDPRTKSQLIAELSAGLELMKGDRMRVRAFFETGGRAVRHIVTTFANTGLAKAGNLVWDNILDWLSRL